MPSHKSQLIIFAMRNSHFLRFQLKREEWNQNTSILRFRQQCEAANNRTKIPDGVALSPFVIPGVTGIQNRHAEWLIPPEATKTKVILYTLGGGYVSGSCSDHRAMVAKITQGSGVSTLLFDHRLAPEDPYPAALEDAVAAYRWLMVQGIEPSNIMIVGESAGGGLCLATLLALRDQGISLPAAAVALSPWTDLTCSGASYRTNARVCLAPLGMSATCSYYYAGGNDPQLPWISPLFGNLHGLPPIYICVGGNETMLDDSIAYAEKAKAAGVDVTLKVWDGMFHCFPLLAPLFPEATQALGEICTFIQFYLDQNRPGGKG